jgi:cardiolipin synthase C
MDRPHHSKNLGGIMKVLFAILISAASAFAQQNLVILDQAQPQLQSKLDVILGAKREVQVSTYIYKSDEIGHWVLGALEKAVQNTGGNVRLLVDKTGTWLNLGFVRLIVEKGVKFAIFEARAAEFPDSFNKRMHDKLVIADNQEVILGSRNLVTGYDLYRDIPNERDIYTNGPAAGDAADHFNIMWTDARTTYYEADPNCQNCLIVNEGAYNKKEKRTIRKTKTVRFDLKEYETAVADSGKYAEALQKESKLNVVNSDRSWLRDEVNSFEIAPDKVQFVSDDVSRLGKASKTTFKIADLITMSKEKILIENPYVILSHEMKKAFKQQRKSAPLSSVHIYTNSSHTNDEGMAQIGYEMWSHELTELGARVYEQLEGYTLHSKSMVVDNEWSYVGSYNMDPRSRNLNTETGLIIQDTRVANRLTELIERRQQMGASEIVEGRAVNNKGRHPELTGKQKFRKFWKTVIVLLFKPQL